MVGSVIWGELLMRPHEPSVLGLSHQRDAVSVSYMVLRVAMMTK